MGYSPEYGKWVANFSAASTVSGQTTMLNWDCGAVQVIWSGVDTSTGVFDLSATIEGTAYSRLASVTTALSTGSSQLYNITDAGYRDLIFDYSPVSNTTGSIEVWICRKSRK